MKKNIYYRFIPTILILLSISSFFIGFIYGENSAGAGSAKGDFPTLWKNLQIFFLRFPTNFHKNNSLHMSWY